MGRAHALLSPSAAHRWLNCTASPLLEGRIEDQDSEYAQEGTLAHAYCAKKLKAWLGMNTRAEDQEIDSLAPKYHTGEMDEYADAYCHLVIDSFLDEKRRLEHARLMVEVRLDFSDVIGQPDCFGTADAVIIGDGTMEVIDFKYGKGVPVSAIGNPQMRIYALGALDRFQEDYDIRTVRMSVVQPRICNMSTDTMSVDDLWRWRDEVLVPKAAEAMDGGRQSPGDWCRFCKVKALCPVLMDEALSTDTTEPSLLTDDEVAAALRKIPMIRDWANSVEAYALEKATGGGSFPGYKLVEGRSVRKVTDTAAAIGALREAGFSDEAIIRPTELRTLTELERTVGKKRFAEICGAWIEKPKGKPTLVPEEDGRKAIDLIEELF